MRLGGFGGTGCVEVIRVVIEVRNGTLRSSVVAQAESIREATCVVAARYPDADVRVAFPIEPEGFFVEDPSARVGIVGFAHAEEMAA
jgi:hypothetical protein